jgi:hypothetical protein
VSVSETSGAVKLRDTRELHDIVVSRAATVSEDNARRVVRCKVLWRERPSPQEFVGMKYW